MHQDRLCFSHAVRYISILIFLHNPEHILIQLCCVHTVLISAGPPDQVVLSIRKRLFAQLLAEVAELVDAQDLKSCVQQWTCGFDPRLRHHHHTIQTASVYGTTLLFSTFKLMPYEQGCNENRPGRA